jgi:hypothetical protein
MWPASQLGILNPEANPSSRSEYKKPPASVASFMPTDSNYGRLTWIKKTFRDVCVT